MELIDQLKAAVWMVGNMDTVADRDAWWETFGDLWKTVAVEGEAAQKHADEMAKGRAQA